MRGFRLRAWPVREDSDEHLIPVPEGFKEFTYQLLETYQVSREASRVAVRQGDEPGDIVLEETAAEEKEKLKPEVAELFGHEATPYRQISSECIFMGAVSHVKLETVTKAIREEGDPDGRGFNLPWRGQVKFVRPSESKDAVILAPPKTYTTRDPYAATSDVKRYLAILGWLAHGRIRGNTMVQGKGNSWYLRSKVDIPFSVHVMTQMVWQQEKDKFRQMMELAKVDNRFWMLFDGNLGEPIYACSWKLLMSMMTAAPEVEIRNEMMKLLGLHSLGVMDSRYDVKKMEEANDSKLVEMGIFMFPQDWPDMLGLPDKNPVKIPFREYADGRNKLIPDSELVGRYFASTKRDGHTNQKWRKNTCLPVWFVPVFLRAVNNVTGGSTHPCLDMCMKLVAQLSILAGMPHPHQEAASASLGRLVRATHMVFDAINLGDMLDASLSTSQFVRDMHAVQLQNRELRKEYDHVCEQYEKFLKISRAMQGQIAECNQRTAVMTDLVESVSEENAELKKQLSELRHEMFRLKGEKKRVRAKSPENPTATFPFEQQQLDLEPTEIKKKKY